MTGHKSQCATVELDGLQLQPLRHLARATVLPKPAAGRPLEGYVALGRRNFKRNRFEVRDELPEDFHACSPLLSS